VLRGDVPQEEQIKSDAEIRWVTQANEEWFGYTRLFSPALSELEKKMQSR
jgi:hypothetical protein